ncbi:DUF3418 domain-containing protein [Sulfuritalea sp.]|uniref:DUF3418 domain-containing protein n=1 Tax=Sulfuritalea sp. TaxID=2480090 RepID=UPI001AD107DE|nr:DUF3418 domain-containing protein [Sulfuritalea sp.]MBN8474413.1 DUF3418 domain-containing protein [Sulfuritalea sp.]
MKKILLILAVALAAGCADPRDTPLPRDAEKFADIKPTLEKLSVEERDLLTGYMMRHAIGAKFGGLFGISAEPIPEGMTLRKAIVEQKEFIAKIAATEAAAKVASEKAEAARKALAQQFAQVVEVRLAKVDLHEATFRDHDVKDYLRMDIDVNNKSGKTITGIKGLLTVRDAFGDKVMETKLKTDSDIPPGATKRLLLTRDYSKFDSKDRKEAAIDATKTTSEFAPDVVLFGDGTKFEAPGK